MLAKMATRAEAARLLVIQAAQRKASGERADLEAGMAKYFATEAAQDNALDCMRIHGGYGYSLEYRPERYYRDAPLLLIGEGSNEIQQLIIARRLLERAGLSVRRDPGCGSHLGSSQDPRSLGLAVRRGGWQPSSHGGRGLKGLPVGAAPRRCGQVDCATARGAAGRRSHGRAQAPSNAVPDLHAARPGTAQDRPTPAHA